MTRTHKEQLLADILAALLRIEALMQREKVADSEVDYWVRELSQPKRHGQPVRPGVVHHIPGMPDPPIAPVRPQTVWSVNKANAPSLNQARWIHATGFSMVGQ